MPSSFIRNGSLSRRLLLKGGTVLIHDNQDNVQALERDILIENNQIIKIASKIEDVANAELIECDSKIISPGFVDTHHHLWQTQLKGRHADELLLDYMASASTAISATVSSGLRSVYGYCPTARVASWSPFEMNREMIASWNLLELRKLGAKAPFGDGRVTMGLAFDLWFLPEQVVQELFQTAREAGINLAATHAVRNHQLSMSDVIQQFKSQGLLDDRMLFSHANGYPTESIQAVVDTGAHISSTPSTEMQMALGTPICLDGDYPMAQAQSSLGIDCHSNQASSIVYEMRLGLQASRANHNQKLINQELAPRHISKTVQEVFNLGTIQGARAIGMQNQLGSIAEGKLADLVIFDANTPELLCAVEQDPLAAIVLHSSIGNVDTVIIDGIVRKSRGKLVDVKVEEDMKDVAGKGSLAWNDVAKSMRKSRMEILEREKKQNFAELKQSVMRNLFVDESKLRD
ncbi:hypothetical protein FVEN_g2179 [Fusarium venenatum]|nr:hypothetical protein FVEN_g2179 [Fusarium venenatum]